MPLIHVGVAIYFIAAALLITAAFVVFRIFVRRDYRQKGRLTLFTSCLELLIWSLYVGFPYLYNPPQWVWFWSPEVPVSAPLRVIGVACITVGLVTTFGTMFWFGLPRAFGLQAKGLVQSGPYRWSRNPQLVGLGLLAIGAAVLWPSWYAAGWVVLAGILGHWMVTTEEEYLRAAYGEAYARYCNRFHAMLACGGGGKGLATVFLCGWPGWIRGGLKNCRLPNREPIYLAIKKAIRSASCCALSRCW